MKCFLTSAQQFLTQKLTELQRNSYVEPSKELIRDFAETFINEKELQVRQGTMRKYRWLIQKYIAPELGGLELRQLPSEHVGDLYQIMHRDHNLSKRPVHHTHVLLKQMLDNACAKGKISINVAKGVKPPKPEDSERQTWNEQEIAIFLECARDSRYCIFFSLALGTGARLGEALAFKWRDLDWNTGRIQVRRALVHGEKGYIIELPKTRQGNRTIKLASATLNDLREHLNRQNLERQSARELWRDDDWITATTDGKTVVPHNIRMAFNRIVEKCGVPRIRIHDLRRMQRFCYKRVRISRLSASG